MSAAAAESPNFPSFSHEEVFARLIREPSGQVCVITPNRRLAQSLLQEAGACQLARGLALWDTPDIISLAGFIERTADAARHAGSAVLPLPLAPEQSRALWEQLLRDSDAGSSLLAVTEAARFAHEAWRLMVSWRLRRSLRDAVPNEDAAAFLEWAPRYERALRRAGQLDAAELADQVLPFIRERKLALPQQVIAYGFDSFTPQQAEFLAGVREAGCAVVLSGPADLAATVLRAPCADAEGEIRRAAAWARSRLEAGCGCIGIVVPDLAARRAAIVRLFSAAMAPDYALPGVRHGVLPFNLSLGEPLSAHALVNSALGLLQLLGRDIEFERASRIIRSPFIAGGEAERTTRAALDVELRRHAEPRLALERLRAMVAGHGGDCPQLRRLLEALGRFRKDRLFGMQAPSAWARAVSEALSLAGFPGERPLDSAEYQTLKRWHETVAAFAALDRVMPRMAYADALSRLRRMAADTLFQPESPDVPVQILGVLEASGQNFDALWVMGLGDDQWPPPCRPNPFLPLAVQRAAGLPQGSAEAALAAARRMTSRWRAAASEVVLSHPLHEGDRELQPSPLIAAVAEARPDINAYPEFGAAIHAARILTAEPDAVGPAFIGGTVAGGGTALLKDQAACPFRAFARHRLHAASPDAPHAGLDAAERGTLVHRVLAQAWMQLRDSATLLATGSDGLDALLAAAAEAAIERIRRDRPTVLSGRFAEIEKRRLVALARAWLDEDRRRDPFAVVAVEDKRSMAIGGLELQARLDRVDETADGRRIIIDYKTGNAAAGQLLGERPEEPQLPLYLVTTEPEALAVAFARVRAGKRGYVGLARDADLLPGIRALADARTPYDDWDGLVAAWRDELERLAGQFAAGAAVVDPKRQPQTCRFCDLGPLCRIRERSAGMDDEGAEE
ncbi:MAG: PD-(D/E)XK nuclease family protein [Burkholderiales bacterium]|nr:PD-(D/E)XK nuclease family protein [Burkholderiales bacterium]